MKNRNLYKNLEEKLDEVSELPPQEVGSLTSVYKRTTSTVKTWPARVIVPIAFVSGILFQLIFGDKIIKIASVLQFGF